LVPTGVIRGIESAGKTDHEVAASYRVGDATVRHLNRQDREAGRVERLRGEAGTLPVADRKKWDDRN
jgi:predicted transcriptional regulator